MRTLPLLLLCSLLLAFSQSASAAPFTLSQAGFFPDVAVDSQGTGHFVWTERVSGSAPDVLHYCRVLRATTSCATEKTFTFNPPDEHQPRVVIANDGTIVLIDYRCCNATPTPDGGSSLDVVYAISSSDGGLNFDQPKIIGTQDPSGAAVFGPGEFNVSLISSQETGGVKFQTAAVDGSAYTEKTAQLGDLGGGVRGQNDGGIGFTNPLTPVAIFTDQDKVYFRKYNAGDYNDVGSWGPGQAIDDGDVPRISTTPAAQPYLLYLTGPPGGKKYVVRRFNGEAFDAPIDVSAATGPIQGQIFADPSGSQHVSYREGGELKYRVSTDGATFAGAETLADSSQGSFFDVQGSAARDTGGWLVYDENSSGPVRAVPVGPQTLPVGDGPPGGCSKETALTGTPAVVTTQEGCFEAESGGRFSTTGDVRVNGVDVMTGNAGGAGAKAARAGTKVIVDPKKRTITTTAAVTVMAGNVKLDQAKLNWTVGKGGKLEGALPDVGKFGKKLLGFAIDGEADIDFKNGEARIPLQVRLPAPYDGITGDVTLRLTKDQGLVLDDLHITVKNTALGPLYIRNLDVKYSPGGDDRFLGRAAFFVPPIGTPPGDPSSEKGAIVVSFEFQGGQFVQASVDTFPLFGLYPPSGLPLYAPYVYLTELGFGLRNKPQLIFRGGATLIGLPTGQGTGLVELDALPQGDITPDPATEGFKLKLSDPAEFSLGGKLKVVGIEFAHGNVFFSTAGIFSFGGSIDFDDPIFDYLFHFDAGIPDNGAFIDVKHGLFAFTSKTHLCILKDCVPYDFEAKLSVNNNGFGVCGTLPLPLPPVKLGFGYDAKAKALEFTGCDLAKYETTDGSQAKAAQAGGGVTLKGGMPEAGVKIVGSTGAPKVTVAGPDGEQIASSAEATTSKDNMVLIESAPEKATYLFVDEPAGGAWAISANSGSSPIASFAVADGLPPASVKAKVSGKKRQRTLSYTVKQIPGQKVTFAEQGIAGGSRIGVASKAKGKIAFAPGEGPGGKRNIIALIEQDGRVRDNRQVASYVAPPPARPGKPGKPRLKRTKKGLRITWRKAPGAASYRVRVILSRDGRRLLQLTKAPSLAVPDLLPKEKVTVAITGIGRNTRAGPTVRATVRFRTHR